MPARAHTSGPVFVQTDKEVAVDAHCLLHCVLPVLGAQVVARCGLTVCCGEVCERDWAGIDIRKPATSDEAHKQGGRVAQGMV